MRYSGLKSKFPACNSKSHPTSTTGSRKKWFTWNDWATKERGCCSPPNWKKGWHLRVWRTSCSTSRVRKRSDRSIRENGNLLSSKSAPSKHSETGAHSGRKNLNLGTKLRVGQLRRHPRANYSYMELRFASRKSLKCDPKRVFRSRTSKQSVLTQLRNPLCFPQSHPFDCSTHHPPRSDLTKMYR